MEAHQNGIHTKGEPYPYPTDPEPGNPTVIPYEILSRFHFAFLIRDPHLSIPSYYRCTIPPLDKVTGFHNYDPSEAGYDELRRGFDYLRTAHLVGPRIATRDDDTVTHRYDSGIEICVIDADDMLHKPAETIEAFCRSVGFEYTPDMLKWDTEEDYRYAKETFEKWRGFHNDAIESKGLVAREGVGCTNFRAKKGKFDKETKTIINFSHRNAIPKPKKNTMPSGVRNTATRAPPSSARPSIRTWWIICI